jgi:general stress protein YciG
MNDVKQYLSKIGRKGGKSKSRAKLAAARENGKLGGRPKLNRK